MASGFQRLTELVHVCLLQLTPQAAVFCLDSFPKCSSYRDCLLSLFFVGSQFQHWLSVTIELRKKFSLFLCIRMAENWR